MNRHQSNPFLSGWDAEDDVETQNTGVFDMDTTIQGSEHSNLSSEHSVDVAARRHSSSQADICGNPFGAQRSADRRLYHRNMSSFEAASLQLEQQQMQENGSVHQSSNQSELIAKMTADFQSAIETNDKQFAIGGETLGEDGNPIELNAFDPFETIVDDDVSLPSPAPSTNQMEYADKFSQPEDRGSNKNDQGTDVNRPKHMDLDAQQPKNIHDSIDDDDEELISTPVRNIKSSPKKASIVGVDRKFETCPTGEDNVPVGEANSNSMSKECTGDQDSTSKSNDVENTNSIEKASLFASLLASAESGGQPTAVDNNTPIEGLDSDTNHLDHDNTVSHLANVEHATHVIMGSHSTGDGNVDRPVGYFDPFETVIDKDALTSLMNDNNQNSKSPENSEEIAQTGKSSDSTNLINRPNNNDHEATNSHLHQDINFQSGLAVESVSVETVIENSSTQSNEHESGSSVTAAPIAEKPFEQQSNSVRDGSSDYNAVPRPVKSSIGNVTAKQPTPIVQDHPKITPAKKPNRQRKKPSFQEDSSDSSEDDDRIQIVIKARNTSQIESKTGPTFVPLLPPPPSKSSMKQARERGQVDDMPSPVMSYKTRHEQKVSDNAQSETVEVNSSEDLSKNGKEVMDRDYKDDIRPVETVSHSKDEDDDDDYDQNLGDGGSQFVIPMVHSDEEGDYGKPDTPLYDEDTSYVLEEFPAKYEGPGWDMMLRHPPKKKLTGTRYWKKIFVKLAQVPLVPDSKSKNHQETNEPPQTCIALQVYDKPEDKKPMQEIPIQATFTVSEISSQQLDQFGKIFTVKLQYIFYKERVGVRQGQLARFIHAGHIGSSTTSGGHGVDPISIGAIKRMGAPIEHSPQISQIIKLGCASYSDIKQFKNCLEDYLFKMPIHRDRALSTYKTKEVQMAVRDETYLELNQVGTIIRQLARVRLFFLSFLNGMPTVEVGINDIHRQGREVVGRMDILPVVTEEWIRLEAWELHSAVEKEEFENPDSRIIKLVPPDATFFELMRFRVRPPRNRELPLQISANMSVTRTRVNINCDVMVPGCVSRKHGQIPCEGIAIRVFIPECWIYFFREEKHFRMGSKKSVNRRPGKVKGIERFLGGGGLQDINDESSLIEVTSGQAKYEHHHQAIVWRAARWPKESQSAYVQNTMKIRLPLTAYDKMPENFYEYVHVEYTMPATTVSHTTLRSISVNPCDDEPPEKYVKYSAKYEYKVKMRLSVNTGSKPSETQPEASPIVIMKQPDLHGDLQREEDSDDGSEIEDGDQGEGQ